MSGQRHDAAMRRGNVNFPERSMEALRSVAAHRGVNLSEALRGSLRDAEVSAVEDGEGDRWKLRLTATDGTEVVLGTVDPDSYQSWLVLESISA